MSDEGIRIEHDQRGLARLILDRAEIHNAFDDGLVAALDRALESLAADPAVQVVELRGAGPSFSAGADLRWMRRVAGYTREQNLEDALALARMLERLAHLPQPTVAVVQGPALGGGAGLVACCDLVVASERAVFAFSEVRLGLVPGTIGPFVVAALGAREARRWFLTGERFDAHRARAIGLVHEVAPSEALEETAAHLTDTLLGHAAGTLGRVKELVRFLAARGLEEATLHGSAERIAAARASAEGREGVSAFLEKRPPRWPRAGGEP
jgi:methylglutaconyl-CoA hydratase